MSKQKRNADKEFRLSSWAIDNPSVIYVMIGIFFVMGLSAYEAEGAFLALQQMLAKGKVTAEELSGQLSERIPTAFADAAEAMGMTTRQLSKALEQGEVEAKTFVTRLSDLWVQKFGGQIPDATENANIAITDFGNAVAELQIAVARSGFLEGLTMGLAKVSALLTDEALVGEILAAVVAAAQPAGVPVTLRMPDMA